MDMITRVFILLIALVLAINLNCFAVANIKVDPALELATNIVSYYSDSEKITISEEQNLLNEVFEAYVSRSPDEDVERFNQFKKSFPFFAEIIEAYRTVSEIDFNDRSSHPEYQKLRNYKFSKDPRERWGASFTLAQLYYGEKRIGEAIAEMEIALNEISESPNEYGFERFQTYNLMMTAFILDYNVESAITAGEELLIQAKSSGYELAPISILNNLAVLKLYEGDAETGISILKTADPIIEPFSRDNRTIYNYTMGRLLNRIGEYAEGERYLKVAQELNVNEVYIPFIGMRLAEAYAGQGRADESTVLLEQLSEQFSNSPSWDEIASKSLEIRSKNEWTKGNARQAYMFQQQWSDYEITRLEDALSNDRQTSMERLAFSERLLKNKLDLARSERKAALTLLENEKSQRRMMTYVMGLIVILSFVLLFAYLLQRKMGKELMKARDRAVSGEKMKTEFMGMMNHEVRTPLNAIIPLADQLGRDLSGNKQQKSMLTLISQSGQQLLTILDHIMMVAGGAGSYVGNIDDIHFFNFVRNEMIDYAKSCADKDLEFAVKVTPDLDRIMTIDKRLLSMCFQICLSNAIKFSNEGRIQVSCQLDAANPNMLLIKMSDQGIGMSETVVRRLGEPFEAADMSRKRYYGGTGLGIATLEVLSQATGMDYIVKSVEGKGTAVQIKIPIDCPSMHMNTLCVNDVSIAA